MNERQVSVEIKDRRRRKGGEIGSSTIPGTPKESYLNERVFDQELLRKNHDVRCQGLTMQVWQLVKRMGKGVLDQAAMTDCFDGRLSICGIPKRRRQTEQREAVDGGCESRRGAGPKRQ